MYGSLLFAYQSSIYYRTNKNYRAYKNTYRPHFNEFSRNSPEKVIQSGVIEIGLYDHELIYFTRKTSLFKINEHYEISIKTMKN